MVKKFIATIVLAGMTITANAADYYTELGVNTREGQAGFDTSVLAGSFYELGNNLWGITEGYVYGGKGADGYETNGLEVWQMLGYNLGNGFTVNTDLSISSFTDGDGNFQDPTGYGKVGIEYAYKINKLGLKFFAGQRYSVMEDKDSFYLDGQRYQFDVKYKLTPELTALGRVRYNTDGKYYDGYTRYEAGFKYSFNKNIYTTVKVRKQTDKRNQYRFTVGYNF